MLYTPRIVYISLVLFSCLLFISCGKTVSCDEEVLGLYSFTVSTSSPNSLNVRGGSTEDARIEKIEEISNDLYLLKASATVVDGITCVSEFTFSYDLEEDNVKEIREVVFGCDTLDVWRNNEIDADLFIDRIGTNVTNVSGSLQGIVTSNNSQQNISFVFDDIPICLE